MKSEEKTFKTPELLLDSVGNMYTKTSIELMIDGRRSIAVLDAEQAELLVKLLRVVEYAE